MHTRAHLALGETIENRDKKFANVGHGVVYASGPATETMRDATTYQLTQVRVCTRAFVRACMCVWHQLT